MEFLLGSRIVFEHDGNWELMFPPRT